MRTEVNDPDLDTFREKGLHAVRFTKSDGEKDSRTTIEHLTTAELEDLVAAAELRLDREKLVIRLPMPPRHPHMDLSPGDLARMAANAAQTAGVSISFIAQNDLTGILQQWLVSLATHKCGDPECQADLTPEIRIGAVEAAMSLTPKILGKMGDLFMAHQDPRDETPVTPG